MESVKCNKTRRRKFLDSPRLNIKLPEAWAYKDFLIGDLFEKVERGNISNRANLVKDKNGVVFICQNDTDNGYVGKFLPENNKIFSENSLVLGRQTGVIYFQPEKFITTDGVLVLTNKEFLKNTEVGIYVTSTLKRSINNFCYTNTLSAEKLRKITISLPIIESGEIDFAFMEHYIRELELARIRELEIFLKVCGFTDCNLTQEELSAIEKFRMGEVKQKEIELGELFDIHPTKSYGYTNEKLFAEKGNIPVIVNSSMNNGIGGYINKEPTEKGNKITFSDTTTSDAIFYQPNDFIGYSHVQGLYAKRYKTQWEESTLLYFLSCFRKNASGRFDYATKFTRKIAMEMKIVLPITRSGEIDFDFMQVYIRAIEKQAIKHVIDWKDKEIAETKKICK